MLFHFLKRNPPTDEPTRGFALFLLDRLQIGQGGRVGPSGLVEAVAAKAAEGMKVIVIQGAQSVHFYATLSV